MTIEMSDEFRSNVEFTAGARRALDVAALWHTGQESSKIAPEAVLLGLLDQGECRAAAILRRFAVTVDAVRERWPELRRSNDSEPASQNAPRRSGWPLSPTVRLVVDRAADWLAEHRQPPELASEHLLWGLASGPDEVATWLCGRGVDGQSVEKELARLHGHLPESDEEIDNEPIGEPIDVDGVEDSSEGASGESCSDVGNIPRVAAARQDRSSVLRVIDAAANRGREGLRVVEDYVRFVLDDGHLTGRLKHLRHDLAALLESVPLELRLAARETQADVGTQLSTEGEQRREGPDDVLAANFCRLHESLRTLEEFAKLIDPRLAAGLEQLRYRGYTLQRAVAIARRSNERLAAARLYVLVDGRATIEDFRRLADELVHAGADVVQLRDKGLDDRTLLAWARYLREITERTGTLLAVNDRPDVALLARADAVHVGQGDLPVKDVRALVGPEMLVGVSVHDIEQARAAVLDGADYLGVGPTFPSATKSFDDFPGLELLRAVAAEISLPAFAIGGIDRENLPRVLATGIRRIAASAAVINADDPAAVVASLKTMLVDAEPHV